MKLLAATLDRIFFVCTALIFIGGNVDFYLKATAQEYNWIFQTGPEIL